LRGRKIEPVVARRQDRSLLPFLAGALCGAAGTVLWHALQPRRGFSPRLIRTARNHPDLPATVIVPGVLGSQLRRPDGSEVWLNAMSALGYYDLKLPATLPLSESTDQLRPGGLVGVDAVLPRLFGITEYADLVQLLEAAGFHRESRRDGGRGAVYHVFTYDWRRDLVEGARRLGATLDAMAAARRDAHARFNVIGHSMGGLVARYYLRYGGAEPGGKVSWEGARRIENLLLVATPNAGSIPSLDAVLNGNRVGFSSTMLAAPVVARMPAIYQLLPARESQPLIDAGGESLDADLLDPETWRRFGWGPWRPSANGNGDEREFLRALLARARAFHAALAKAPATPCPVRVVALGGDCLPTLARAIAPERPGEPPRFEPWTRLEGDRMFEAGDGRVTRASVLASHLPGAARSVFGSGIPEVSHAFIGEADHHGIYSEPTFQSLLMRLLLQPALGAAEAAS
jgi:pimeloyl-ACP methyl ester carboxylesterase